MKEKNYQIKLTVNANPQAVFRNLNAVKKWWTEDLTGSSAKTGDSFTVRFGDVHVSTQKIIEMIPDKKIVWLVTESNLNFIKNRSEWTNTKIIFEIITAGNKTEVLFTHDGLVPEIECYTGCSKGWDYYLKGSLYKLLTEGKGTPELK